MKKIVRYFGIVLALLVTPSMVLAEEINVTVKGMVCSFCAQGIKKTFLKNEGVADIKVDLDNRLVKIQTREGASIPDDEIRKAIVDSGFDVVSIERGKSA